MSMAAYFGRDSVALPGLEKYFRQNSDEVRDLLFRSSVRFIAALPVYLF
jgi:hypothetical protein